MTKPNTNIMVDVYTQYVIESCFHTAETAGKTIYYIFLQQHLSKSIVQVKNEELNAIAKILQS